MRIWKILIHKSKDVCKFKLKQFKNYKITTFGIHHKVITFKLKKYLDLMIKYLKNLNLNSNGQS